MANLPIAELSLSDQKRIKANFLAAYQESPIEEKVMNSKRMKAYDKKAFINDYHLFNDSNEENIFDDYFQSMPCRTSDGKYDWAITKRLESAKPNKTSLELGEEDTNMARASSQLDRMIIQDCVNSGGQIRILQETPVGTCSIPSQYQIDKISQFANITLEQAQVISKIYRILELGFKEIKKINKAIRARSYGKKPWDIIVNKSGMTILKLAQEMKALALEPQEDPKWAKYDNCDTWSSRHIDQEAINYDNSFSYKDYDTYRSNQWEQTNPVKEFTYWNNSVIPVPRHLEGRKASQFGGLLDSLESYKLSNQEIKINSKWVNKKCSAIQKSKWVQSVHMITGLQANIRHQILLEMADNSSLNQERKTA